MTPIVDQWTASNPLEQMAAPISPPMSVCEDEEGMPRHQVIRLQKKKEDSYEVEAQYVLGNEERHEIEERRPHNRHERLEDLSGNDRGNGVRRVVKAVNEIESEGENDNGDEVSHTQAYLTMMVRSVFPTWLARSVASSIHCIISLILMSSLGSDSVSKSSLTKLS